MTSSPLPHDPSLQARLERNSRLDPRSGCRLWTRALNTNGYGVVTVSGKSMLAHRAAWTTRHGAIPRDLLVCHRCDVRTCINPDHLFLGTPKDNMVDKKKKMGLRTELLAREATRNPSVLLRLQFDGQEIVSQVLSVRPIVEPPDRESVPRFPEESAPTGS